MQFDGAVINEQGVRFAIVVVKPNVLDISTTRENTRRGVSRYFPGIPVILMAQDSWGNPIYHGRPDIVEFLANIDSSRIPFKQFTAN